MKIVGERKKYLGRGNMSGEEYFDDPAYFEETVVVEDIRNFPEHY